MTNPMCLVKSRPKSFFRPSSLQMTFSTQPLSSSFVSFAFGNIPQTTTLFLRRYCSRWSTSFASVFTFVVIATCDSNTSNHSLSSFSSRWTLEITSSLLVEELGCCCCDGLVAVVVFAATAVVAALVLVSLVLVCSCYFLFPCC